MHCCVPMYIARNMSAILIIFTCALLIVFNLPRKNIFHSNQLVKSFHIVPGWNEYVKDRHAVARDALWL